MVRMSVGVGDSVRPLILPGRERAVSPRGRQNNHKNHDKLTHVATADEFYARIKCQILRYQSFTTGLYPRYSTDLTEGYVRDSIFCAIACWSLSAAYERLDDDRGRTYELGQSAVKTMRGILFAWMSQSETLEDFKANPSPKNALHSKFGLFSGLPVVDVEHYGHLQIDIVAIYLITLVQMITSGLQIIFTKSEVNFIQNLVFYIERAYRTPDFGIWECGTRYNDGTCELHASSVGHVKAALEAINGFNLFGSGGTSGSIVYVDIDAHNRNRTTFETLLPRESGSKNTDACLLACIGFPSFATHDEAIYKRTIDKVVRRLKGKYGFKRFLRDGLGTALCDPTHRFYAQGETKLFDQIESQWPLFNAFMMIEAIFQRNEDGARKYKEMLEPLLIQSPDGPLLPQYYYLPEESIMREKSHPGSQIMIASFQEAKEKRIFLWGQAVYLIASMLDEKVVMVSELDPVHRHLPASQRPKLNNRHSVFQGSISDPVVQIALISESAKLQAMLSTYGIHTQTPHQVEPVQIWSSGELVKVFNNLGKNKSLKLSGRPPRPIGSLGTSKLYRICGNTILCYPLLFEISDFYMGADPSVIIDDIKKDITFVANRWKLSGRPTFCVLLREESISAEQFPQLLSLLVSFKNGFVDNNTRVRVGRVQNLLSGSCLEHLDFADPAEIDANIRPFQETFNSDLSYAAVLEMPTDVCGVSLDEDFHAELHNYAPNEELVKMLKAAGPLRLSTQAQLLNLLHERGGMKLVVDEAGTVQQWLERVCSQAQKNKNWFVVRFCAALLRKTADSLSPAITSLLVRGKQLSVGVVGHSEETIDRPLNPSEIADMLFRVCLPYDIPAAVLHQELILTLAQTIATKAEFLSGTLKIRIGWLIEAMRLWISFSNNRNNPATIYSLSPMEVKRLVRDMMSLKHMQNLTPIQQRQIKGALNRVPADFYDRIWKILQKSPHGIIVAGHMLPQQPTLSDMTEYELNFALLIEKLQRKIVVPEYRQLMVELFMVVSTILERNPELHFSATVDFDSLIRDAFEMFCRERGWEKTDDMTQFYELPCQAKTGTASYLARAVINYLLKGDFSHMKGTEYAFVGESKCPLM